MSLNLNPVPATSNKKSGVAFTDAEKAIAREAVIEVITKLGGCPVTTVIEDGKSVQKDAYGQYVAVIREKCVASGNIPDGETYKNGRTWGAYAHLAKIALNNLRTEQATASKAKGKVA